MKNNIRLFLVALTLTISTYSCRKETTKPDATQTNNPTTSSTEYGILQFHLHTFIDAEEVDGYNIVYTTDVGRQLSLSIAQFYVSDIQLEKPDGTFYSVADKKALKILEIDSYLVGNVAIGNYKSIRFKIGLPPSKNAENPYSSSDSLILNHPEMWFSNTAQPDGYVFLNAQGTIDTSADMSGKMCPFVYKIGTNAHYVQVIMPAQNFTITKNQVQFVHMYADYNRLFSGLTLDNTHLNISTGADNNLPLAAQLATNISAMFRYE